MRGVKRFEEETKGRKSSNFQLDKNKMRDRYFNGVGRTEGVNN